MHACVKAILRCAYLSGNACMHSGNFDTCKATAVPAQHKLPWSHAKTIKLHGYGAHGCSEQLNSMHASIEATSVHSFQRCVIPVSGQTHPSRGSTCVPASTFPLQRRGMADGDCRAPASIRQAYKRAAVATITESSIPLQDVSNNTHMAAHAVNQPFLHNSRNAHNSLTRR